MLTYAPNISWLFPGLPFEKRIHLVVEAGFDAFEFGSYNHVDLQAVESAYKEFGLQVVLLNMDIPEWDECKYGYLADPSLQDKFKRKLEEALEVAIRVKTKKMMLPVGVELEHLNRDVQFDCIVHNLSYAASLVEETGVMLTVEAMNSWDMPGYFLTSSREGLMIIKEVNHPLVKFQFDTYHLQLQEGNLTQTMIENIDLIGHIQFGDVPGRSQPGTGELNFANLAVAAEKAGYQGYIGLEYNPVSSSEDALAWVPPERRSMK